MVEALIAIGWAASGMTGFYLAMTAERDFTLGLVPLWLLTAIMGPYGLCLGLCARGYHRKLQTLSKIVLFRAKPVTN